MRQTRLLRTRTLRRRQRRGWEVMAMCKRERSRQLSRLRNLLLSHQLLRNQLNLRRKQLRNQNLLVQRNQLQLQNQSQHQHPNPKNQHLNHPKKQSQQNSLKLIWQFLLQQVSPMIMRKSISKLTKFFNKLGVLPLELRDSGPAVTGLTKEHFRLLFKE